MAAANRPDLDPQALADARAERGLSRPELARRAGVSQHSLTAWERGLRTPDMIAVEKLAMALRMAPADLGVVMPDMDTANLTTLRTSRRITREQMCQRLGVAESTLRRVEAGERLPDDPVAWAKAYGVTTRQLAAAWRRSSS